LRRGKGGGVGVRRVQKLGGFTIPVCKKNLKKKVAENYWRGGGVPSPSMGPVERKKSCKY